MSVAGEERGDHEEARHQDTALQTKIFVMATVDDSELKVFIYLPVYLLFLCLFIWLYVYLSNKSIYFCIYLSILVRPGHRYSQCSSSARETDSGCVRLVFEARQVRLLCT